MTTLEELQKRAKTHWDAATGESAKSLYLMIYDLTSEVISIKTGSSSGDDSLQKQNTKLMADLESLNSLLNQQASVLQKIKDALEAPQDKTAAQLPAYAADVLLWAKTGRKPANL